MVIKDYWNLHKYLIKHNFGVIIIYITTIIKVIEANRNNKQIFK